MLGNKLLDCRDDPDYDPDFDPIPQICMHFLSEVCLWPRTNPLNCG